MQGDLPPHELKARAVKGVTSLLARQLLVRVLGFAAMLVLARILSPEVFGTFAIAQFGVLFFEQVSAAGLSSALLRRKAQPAPIELQTVFTVQQVIVALVVIAALAGAPAIAEWFDLTREHVWLMRAMALGLLLASLKTIPLLLLERRLRHDQIAAVEVAEFFAYQSAAILLALQGWGIWALVTALLMRGLVGVGVLYCVAGWRPRFGFDGATLREILAFGVPLQLANLGGLGTNAIVPVLVGSSLGTAAVGHANFSRTIVDALIFQPLIVMSRVQFRVFASMQEETQRLIRAIERSLYAGSLLTFLCAALVISQARPFIDYVVTPKWAPALPLLYVLSVAYVLYAIVQPLMQALKALGDAKTPLHGIVLQGAIQCLVFLGGVQYLGLKAYAIGLALGLTVATWLAWLRLRRHVKVRVWTSIRAQLVAAGIACAAALGLNEMLPGLAGMAVSTAGCIAVYVIAAGMLDGRRLGQELYGVAVVLVPNSTLIRSAVAGLVGVLASLNRLCASIGPQEAAGK